MLNLPKLNIIVKNPDYLKAFLPEEIDAIVEIEKESALPFMMPPDISKLDVFGGLRNTNKRIYKSGFLFEVYQIIYPTEKKQKLFEIISEKYDVFVEYRQFQRDVKSYNDKKVSIFVE